MSDANRAPKVLWGVVEEHLDEAEFALERFDQAMASPALTIAEVASGPEQMLLAQLDGLVVAREDALEIIDAWLDTMLAGDEPPTLPRATVLVMACLLAGHRRAAAQALKHEAASVRRGAERAWAWLTSATPSSTDGPPRLDAAAPEELVAALAASWGPAAAVHVRRISELLRHDEPAVRDAALVAGLHHRLHEAWELCRALALSPAAPHPLAMTLLAGLGGLDDHRQLITLSETASHREYVLRALGVSGNLAVVPFLISICHREDEIPARLAFEALSTNLGPAVDAMEKPQKATPARPDDAEAAASLPPIEDDDLGANLDENPAAALAMPDGKALSAWWTIARTELDARKRHIAGQVMSGATTASALRAFPTRRHAALLMLASVRTGGVVSVGGDTLTRARTLQIERLGSLAEHAWTWGFALV